MGDIHNLTLLEADLFDDNHSNSIHSTHNNSTFDSGYRIRTILTLRQNMIALILGISAITINILSILAITRIYHTNITSHFRLILNLAASDILIGVSLILFIFINASVELYPVGLGPDKKRLTSRCLYYFSKALNSTALAITLLNLMGMAIDHYVAIMHPLRYDVILTRNRSIGMIVILWILAVIFGFSDLFSAYPKYKIYWHKYNFCEFVHMTKYNEEYTLFGLAIACLVIMLFIYISIYLEVKKHYSRSAQISQDLQKNKKAAITTLVILGTFIILWLPICLFTIALVIQVSYDPEAVQNKLAILYEVDSYLFNLLLVNAIADPIIYAARMKDVQLGWRILFCGNTGRQRRRSNASSDTTQYTAFIDVNRKNSKASNILMFEKYTVNHSADPILKPNDMHHFDVG